MFVTNASELGSAIRDARLAKGWTQAQFAARVGTSRAWVVAVESGSPNARLGMVLQALRWLDLAVDVYRDDADDDLVARLEGQQ